MRDSPMREVHRLGHIDFISVAWKSVVLGSQLPHSSLEEENSHADSSSEWQVGK